MSRDADRDAVELARRFVDLAWNEGDERAAALLGPGFAHHDLVTHAESDADGYLSSILGIRSAFSSIEMQVHDPISAGGRVAFRWTAVGNPRASAAEVRVEGISIDRVADGAIVENWTAWDLLGLQQQLPGLLDRVGSS